MTYDLYAALGISPLASADEITDTFRRLARRRRGDDLKRVKAAYYVLSDPARRAAYDRDRELETGGGDDDRPTPVLDCRPEREPGGRCGHCKRALLKGFGHCLSCIKSQVVVNTTTRGVAVLGVAGSDWAASDLYAHWLGPLGAWLGAITVLQVALTLVGVAGGGGWLVGRWFQFQRNDRLFLSLVSRLGCAFMWLFFPLLSSWDRRSAWSL